MKNNGKCGQRKAESCAKVGRSTFQLCITTQKRLSDLKHFDFIAIDSFTVRCPLQMLISVSERPTFWGWKSGSMMQVAPTQSGHSSLLTMP